MSIIIRISGSIPGCISLHFCNVALFWQDGSNQATYIYSVCIYILYIMYIYSSLYIFCIYILLYIYSVYMFFCKHIFILYIYSATLPSLGQMAAIKQHILFCLRPVSSAYQETTTRYWDENHLFKRYRDENQCCPSQG